MAGELIEARSGDTLLAFDGRVLELFGFSDVHRYHVSDLSIKVDDPDRKGRVGVRIGRASARGGALFGVAPEHWQEVKDVIDRTAAAGAVLE